MIISGDHKTVAVCGPAIIEVNTAIADAIKRYLHIHQQLPANKNKSEKDWQKTRVFCKTDGHPKAQLGQVFGQVTMKVCKPL